VALAGGSRAEGEAGSPPRARAAAAEAPRRLLEAAAAAGAGLVVLVFYLVEASLQKTPWLFTDELEWTQLSRAIAATGHAARRGQPVFFKSLYAYLIAPAWWLHSTAAAYAAIKDANAVVMCLAALPAYLLARMLCARAAALAVAALTIAIPAMSYATSIIPEPLAYLWFSLAAWLAVRALASPRAATVLPALAAAALGPLVRKEFVVLPAALVLAAAALWAAGGPARALRPRLARVLAALAGLALFGFLFNWLVVERIQRWTPGQYVNGHTLNAGVLAFGALAIGLGMLPLIGGLASLALPERRAEPAYRAFAAYLAASIVTLGAYTAAKVTYLAGGGTLVEERNLFFLSPLLLLGTALAFGARRLDRRVLALATLVSLALVWSDRFEQVGPTFEAPGLAILVLVNREFIFYVSDCRLLLAGAAAVSLALLALRRAPRVPLLAAALLGAWLLTGEVYATVTDEQAANAAAARLPPPRGWVDAATHGAHVTVLGEAMNLDPTVLWLTEFWNRSIDRVASVDETAPGPGPTFVPKLVSADGALGDYTGDPYTLAGGGVVLDAPVRASLDGYTLYATPHGWRLEEAEEGVDSDGWQLASALYTYFAPGGPGTLRIDLSRTAYRGAGPAGRVTVELGTVRLAPDGEPAIGRVLAVLHRSVPNGSEVSVELPLASTPVTLEVSVAPRTLIHAPNDPRALGVQVAFCFARGAGALPRC